LSRLANAGRRGLRRYATGTSGGNPTGAPKPAGQSSGAVVPPVASTWLAKKAQLNAGSIGTRLACLAVLGVSGYAIYDQYENRNVDSEIVTAIEALENDSLDETAFVMDSRGQATKISAGFDTLPDLLSTRRRSFSGDVIVPVSQEVLAKYERRLVAALLNAAQDQYENRWKALSMLHTLAQSSESVRHRLRSDLESMHLLMECGTHFSLASSPRHEWLLAADIVTTLLRGEEGAKVGSTDDGKYLIKMFLGKYEQSSNPVAMLVHARLGEIVNMPAPTTTFSKETQDNMIAQALKESYAVDYSQKVSGASLFSAVGFALLGGVWGRLRWALRLTSKGALNAHAWNWSAKKHIARPLALWFMLDMLGTRLLTFASNDKFEFNSAALQDISDIEARANVSGMSLTNSLNQFSSVLSTLPYTNDISLASFLSGVQNISFTFFSLWMISTRRYAFFPLAAAGIYNHYDEVKKIPQVEYVINMGQMQADKSKHYFTGRDFDRKL